MNNDYTVAPIPMRLKYSTNYFVCNVTMVNSVAKILLLYKILYYVFTLLKRILIKDSFDYVITIILFTLILKGIKAFY